MENQDGRRIVQTSRLEGIKRTLADEYMAECPGVTRQEAKRRVEPRARMMLSFSEVSAHAQRTMEAWRRLAAPVFTHSPLTAGQFPRARGRK
jgi:hypothetical protein